MDEMVGVIYREDEGYAGRLAGLNEMQAGTTRVIRGMLSFFESPGEWSLENFAWYASEMVVLLPQLMGRLNTAQQVALQQQIGQVAAVESVIRAWPKS